MPSQPSHSGDPLSDHPYPRRTWRRLTGWLAAAGLAGIVFGVIGLLALGIGYGLPLLLLMAFFLATLAVPLLLLTVLHPHITVYPDGLWLKPLVWRGTWVPWAAIASIEDHTLIRRGQQRDRDTEHFGQIIVVDGALPPLYAIVGMMAGLGRARAFGISTYSHTDYPRLLNAIQRHKPRQGGR